MSYYSHPFFGLSTTPSPSPQPQPRRVPAQAYGYGQTFDDLYHDDTLPLTLEEEEAAALAHLRSIQHRRAQAQAQAQAQARARQQREAAIRAEIARLAAQQEAEQRQRQREQLVQARAQAQAQARAHALALRAQARARAQAIQERAQAQAIRERAQVQAQRARAHAQACAARHNRNAQSYVQNPEDNLGALLASLFGISPQSENESPAPAPAPAPAQPAPPAQQTPVESPAAAATAPSTAPATEDKATFPEDINALLSQFLGLRVEPTSESAPATTAGNQAESSSTPKNVVPQGLNEFLSRFGLVFEPEEPEAGSSVSVPATTTEQSTTGAAATSSSVPSAPAAAPTLTQESSSNTAATADNTSTNIPPITALLEQYAELNPLMRDIFGNLEHAFTNEYHRKRGGRPCATACQKKCAKGDCVKDKGKGKEVAEGEKNAVSTPVAVPISTSAPVPAPTVTPVTPAPAPTSTSAPVETTPDSETTSTASSLSALDSIKDQLSSLQSSFTFPAQLAFAHTTPGVAAPPLLFNRTNSSYHAQTHALLQLLLQADGISSGGDKEVRQKRKALVRAVEKEIEQLEKKRDDQWELVKEKRERGEESEPEDDGRSSGWSDVSSNVEHEHIEDINKLNETEVDVETQEPAVEGEHQSYADVAKAEPEPESSAQEGFEVPAQEQAQATATKVEEADTEAKGDQDEGKPEPKSEQSHSTKEAKDNKENDKEEGYELL